MAAGRPGATIAIADSQFVGNGACGNSCTDALSAGVLATLRVENTVFKNNHGRDAIRSQVDSTQLVGNEIASGNDAAPGYLVELPSGGSLLMQANSLAWLPARAGRDAAVFVAAGFGAQAVKNLVLRNNIVVGQTAASAGALLLKNWPGRDADIEENRLPDGIIPVSSAGYHWFLGKSYLRAIYETFRGMAHGVLAKVYHLVF